jgi:MoaA/NifB/PqqE/SkfB family radical SAM enzyme
MLMKTNTYSEHKILKFPEKLNSFENNKITAPIYVRVKPINRCDHSCFFCVYSTRFRKNDRENHIISGMHTDMVHEDIMPTEKMFEILQDFSEMDVKAVTYSGGGEPLMHRDIVEIMKKTLEYNIDLSIITNGQMLLKQRAEVLSFAKWVRVSIDYTNSAQMSSSRGVSEKHFDMVMQNIRTFSRIKKPYCELGINYIIHRDNYEGIDEFAKLLKDCGVTNVRFSPMWTPDIVEYHTPIADKVREQLHRAALLIDDNFSLNTTYNIQSQVHAPSRAYSKCHFMQIVPVIGADQVVYACHNKAYDKTGAIGSLRGQRFRDLWFSDEARHVFETLNPTKQCNHQCANDAKNIFIENILTANYDNFV